MARTLASWTEASTTMEKGSSSVGMPCSLARASRCFRVTQLISMEDNRFKLCNIKTLNLIPSVLANQRAAEAGCDEWGRCAGRHPLK